MESGFRDLKDVIEMRPVYHKTDERIKAHMFVATLGLFLKRSLEHQLAPGLPALSGSEGIAAMRRARAKGRRFVATKIDAARKRSVIALPKAAGRDWHNRPAKRAEFTARVAVFARLERLRAIEC